MATPALITWSAPEHAHTEKTSDWYWSVGIICLAISAVCIIFGNVITGILVIVATVALVIFISHPVRTVEYKINDRGIVAGDVLYPFVDLESFWVPHDAYPPRLLVKSRKLFMPLIVIYIADIDPDDVREVMLTYITEKEQREPFLKHVLEYFGF